MHINVSAMTKDLALKAAHEQLDSELGDSLLAEIIYGYVEERVKMLPEAGGRAVEITADVNINVEAYLRIA